MKKIAATLAGITLALATTFSSFAGWVQSGNRWWYSTNANGTTWYSNGWQQIDGAWYYFDANGWMLADTTTPDGFYVNASGAWVPNQTAQTANTKEIVIGKLHMTVPSFTNATNVEEYGEYKTVTLDSGKGGAKLFVIEAPVNADGDAGVDMQKVVGISGNKQYVIIYPDIKNTEPDYLTEEQRAFTKKYVPSILASAWLE